MSCMITKCVNNYCFQESFPIINTPYTSGDTLLQELSLFPEGKELISEAQDVISELGLGKLKVTFNQTLSGFEAEQLQNHITIKPNLPASRQRSCFLFELTNVIQMEKHERIYQNLWKYKSGEEYARAHEFVEFEGLVRYTPITRRINSLCVSDLGSYLKTGWERYKIESMGFEEYYKVCDPSHHDYFRKIWEESMRPNYLVRMKVAAIFVTPVLVSLAVNRIFDCAFALF